MKQRPAGYDSLGDVLSLFGQTDRPGRRLRCRYEQSSGVVHRAAVVWWDQRQLLTGRLPGLFSHSFLICRNGKFYFLFNWLAR